MENYIGAASSTHCAEEEVSERNHISITPSVLPLAPKQPSVPQKLLTFLFRIVSLEHGAEIEFCAAS